MKRIINNLIFFSVFIVGCSSVSDLDSKITPSVNADTEKPSTTVTEVAPQIDNDVSETAQPEQLSYEFLSPTIITNKPNTMTFEVSATLTQSAFQFRIDAIVPPEFEFSYPDYIYPDIYRNVELLFAPALEIEQTGGGGGSQTLGGKFSLNTEIDYRILNTVTLGQTFHLKAVILFSEFTTISEPVPFEIILTVN
jgi:hypothetical protein